MLNKKAMIIASGLGAIPLAAVLIVIVNRKVRRSSLQGGRISEQTRSKSNAMTDKDNAIIIHTQQQKKESQSKSVSPLRGSEEVKMMTAADTNAHTHIASTDKDKDITIPAAIAVIAPSPVEPSRSIGSSMIVSPPHTREQELSISDEAKKAGESLKELIKAAIKDAKDSAKGTGKKIKEETVGIAATTDSKDIQSLGDNVDTLVGLFEKMMAEIRKEHYNEQIILLQSYK
ncbi:MAG: hypothetical protein M3115_03170, partial [Thermoproteota archaeon]|nr:hypothetical protein [Thermoproteota archaeon]